MRPPYDAPGIYTVHIEGTLDENWANRLGGLSITAYEEDEKSGRVVTVLKGSLPDQAALLGVLNTLYNMRYPLLLVRYLRPDSSHETAMADQEQHRELSL
jgi:hypothetical protein